MKYKTVGVVLGVLAMMALGTAYAAKAPLPDDVLTDWVKVPDGFVERGPAGTPFAVGVVSDSAWMGATNLGGWGTTILIDSSEKKWFRYNLYKGETIVWKISHDDTVDYDMFLYKYEYCGALGALLRQAVSATSPDSIVYTNKAGDDDFEEEWVYLKIHNYSGPAFPCTLTNVREPPRNKPICLTNYCLTDWGFPENGVEGTFNQSGEHWYVWVVPSYFHEFALQLDGGTDIEIWNDCHGILLASGGPGAPTTPTIVGYQDSVVLIAVYGGAGTEYRINYSSHTMHVPDIGVTPNHLFVELDKGQSRDYPLTIENTSFILPGPTTDYPSVVYTISGGSHTSVVPSTGKGGDTLASPGDTLKYTLTVTAPAAACDTTYYDEVDVEVILYDDGDGNYWEPLIRILKHVAIDIFVPCEYDCKPDKEPLTSEHIEDILMPMETVEHTFKFKNAGCAKLHWSIDTLCYYDPEKLCQGEDGSPFEWLCVGPDSGVLAPGATTSLTFTMSSGMMHPGHHYAEVGLLSNDPDDPYESLTVDLFVKAPNKVFDPGSFDVTLMYCDTTYDTLVIWNDGTTMLEIHKITWNPFVDWLMVNGKKEPVEAFSILPGQSVEVILGFDSHGICCEPCATCLCTLQIQSNDPYCPEPEEVYISLTLEERKIRCGPQEIHAVERGCPPGEDPEDKKADVWICNIGCAMLHWYIDETTLPSWVRLPFDKYPAAGSTDVGECDTFTIALVGEGMLPGNYSGTIDIVNDSWNDPVQQIPVFMRAEGAVLTIDPTSLDIIVPKHKTHREIIKICNDGNVNMDWDLSGLPSWITASAITGMVEPKKCHEIELEFNSVDAGPGSHKATLTFHSDDDCWNPDAKLAIAFKVLDAEIAVTPGSIYDSLVVDECETYTLTVQNGKGDLALEWSLVESPWVHWVSANPKGGVVEPGGSQDVTVEVCATQLDPCSTYCMDIIFNHNDNTNDPIVVDVCVLVGKPSIYLSRTELDFGNLQPCEGITEELTFIVQNDGVHIPLEYTIEEDCNWLEVDPAMGTLDQYEEDVITVTVDPDELPSGDYSCILTITSNDPENPVVTVEVKMTIIAAVVDVTPGEFDIHIAIEKTLDTIIVIENTGEKPSPWHIQTTFLVHWLSFTPASGTIGAGETDTIDLTFDARGIGLGQYSVDLVFEAEHDHCSPKDIIPVTMYVEAPIILVDPECFYVTLGVAESMYDTLDICNAGVAALNYTVDYVLCGLVDYTELGDGHVEPTECEGIELHFDATGFAPGLYSDTIVINSNDPVNPVVEVCVNIEVKSPVMVLTETSFDTTGASTERFCVNAAFGIVNEGDVDLDWLIQENPYVSWLSEDPLTGTTAPDETTFIQLCFDATEADVGDNVTDVVVVGNDPMNPDDAVTVTFTVTSSKLVVTPGNVHVGMNVGDAMERMLSIRNTSEETVAWSLACKDDIDWLEYPKANALNPGETDDVPVKFDATGLTNGVYETTLKLASSENEIDIPVKLIVSLRGVEEQGLAGACDYVYVDRNLPNPFTSKTSIEYGVPKATHVNMKVYDCSGKEVKRLVDAEVTAGRYIVSWDGTDDHGNDLVSGIYFYRLTADGTSITKKLILLR